METVTTLVEYEVKSGTTKKGPWKFYVFKDNAGDSYQTPFNSDALGTEATNYLNQPARISYEVVTRGDFQNNVIQAIQSANGSTPSGPIAAQYVPIADDPPASYHCSPPRPPKAPQPANNDRELKIHRQTAAKVAAQLLGYFDAEEQNLDTFYVIADGLIDYFQSGSPVETVAA